MNNYSYQFISCFSNVFRSSFPLGGYQRATRGRALFLTNPASLLLGIQSFIGTFVGAIQVTEALAQAPELHAATAKAGKDTARTTVLIDIQRRIARSITIANVDTGVHLGKVTKLHPKGTIVRGFESHLSGNAGMLLPQFGLVRPIALPFVGTPGIAQLQELEGFATRFRNSSLGFFRNFHGRNQTVRMTRHQSSLLHHLFSGGSIVFTVFHFTNTRRHERLLLVVLFEQGPDLVGRVTFLGFTEAALTNVTGITFRFHGHHVFANPLRFAAAALLFLAAATATIQRHLKDIVSRHGQPTPQDKTTFDIRITATQFGVGLFQQNGPQFIAIGFHETRFLGTLFTRNVIINGDHDPLFFERMVNTNLVQSTRIEFLGQKHVSNHIGKFTSTGKGGHQPTITHGTLTQIIGFNFSFKQLGSLVFEGIQILGADPIGVFFHLFARFLARIILVVITQGFGTVEFIILVGPSHTATQVLPQTTHHQTLAQDGRAGDEVNADTLDNQTDRAHNGTAQQIPKESGATGVDFFRGRSHAFDVD
mmetsp:Transcript_8149/g.17001  ORF Transcript_8149/g.17001 Transcript_8149/m.17001 type:complete len:536 (-) Transcript_8149:132-1739(-)